MQHPSSTGADWRCSDDAVFSEILSHQCGCDLSHPNLSLLSCPFNACGQTPPSEVVPAGAHREWSLDARYNQPVTQRRPIYSKPPADGVSMALSGPAQGRDLGFLACTLHLRSLRGPRFAGRERFEGAFTASQPTL